MLGTGKDLSVCPALSLVEWVDGCSCLSLVPSLWSLLHSSPVGSRHYTLYGGDSKHLLIQGPCSSGPLCDLSFSSIARCAWGSSWPCLTSRVPWLQHMSAWYVEGLCTLTEALAGPGWDLGVRTPDFPEPGRERLGLGPAWSPTEVQALVLPIDVRVGALDIPENKVS